MSYTCFFLSILSCECVLNLICTAYIPIDRLFGRSIEWCKVEALSTNNNLRSLPMHIKCQRCVCVCMYVRFNSENYVRHRARCAFTIFRLCLVSRFLSSDHVLLSHCVLFLQRPVHLFWIGKQQTAISCDTFRKKKRKAKAISALCGFTSINE